MPCLKHFEGQTDDSVNTMLVIIVAFDNIIMIALHLSTTNSAIMHFMVQPDSIVMHFIVQPDSCSTIKAEYHNITAPRQDPE